MFSDDNLDGECEKFSDLILNYKTKFDLLLVIPIINVAFNLNDFRDQLKQMNNMGNISKMMKFLPNIYLKKVGKC